MSLIFPSEWSPQSAILLSWPHENTDWHPILREVEQTYQEITLAISRFQTVLIVCNDENLKLELEKRFEKQPNHERIQFVVSPTDDTWIRDYGPLTVFKNASPQLLNFQFNGWGNKFDAKQDNFVSACLHKQLVFCDTPMTTIPIVLEGGSIESDGAGTLLTTSDCLLSPKRNPQFTRSDIEDLLKQSFGVNRVLWLHHGHIEGDDTDGHIDTLARFCSETRICYVHCDDQTDPHYSALYQMKQELEKLRTHDGNNYELVPLPWPSAKYDANKRRLPATYANFLIINGAVLLPVYNDDKDSLAVATLQHCFPDREIISIDCSTLIKQSGSLHCITMQLPAGVIK